MSTHMMIEMIGYIGSVLVLISFLMSSVVKLRVINAVGGTIFSIYALIIQSYPTAIMNICLVAINIYYLARLKRNDRHYDIVDGAEKDAMLTYILNYYKEDIKKYFPEWNVQPGKADKAYVVCCDAVPAGVLIGKQQADGALEILLDYATPTYRDCSVGRALYKALPALGIRKLVFSRNSGMHEPYLKKMGFVQETSGYVKKL
ncbi:MAG: YgjV family protein [Lachnospiraceae bacterium]|nr:YgjV family protein [Lachnospiraceae bacterium]